MAQLSSALKKDDMSKISPGEQIPQVRFTNKPARFNPDK